MPLPPKENYYIKRYPTPCNVCSKHRWTAQNGRCYDCNFALNEKDCKRCNEVLPLTDFYLVPSGKNGLHSWCKQCENATVRGIAADPLRKIKRKEYDKKYRVKNKESRRTQGRKYERERRASDPNYKLLCNLRNRMNAALNGRTKRGHTGELTGCSIEFLWQHLSSMFVLGMTRENYGKLWHVDHIVPISSFNKSELGWQEKCFHYTNLQPLWKEDNLAKGRKTNWTKEK
jgi:hypothetical protein